MFLLQKIDDILNNVTMYRLILYVLATLATISILFAATGIIRFSPLSLIISAAILLLSCYATNLLFSRLLKAPANIESHFITALILYFLLLPPTTITQMTFVAAAGAIAMTSKYIFAIRRKHIFNPAAFAVAAMGYSGLYGPIWWPVDPAIVPFIALGGFLIVRKIRRFQMVFTFFAVTTAVLLVFTAARGGDLLDTVIFSFTRSPLFFFATIMLTEPLTTPPTRSKQIAYASIVGVFYSFQAPIGPIYSSPELALLVGNVFSYIVSSKERLILTLKEKIHESGPIYTYVFSPSSKLSYHPGQYLEWTLPHEKADRRGNRRYFTIASSPSEKDIMLGVKFYTPSSTLKKNLKDMKEGEKIAAGQLAGDFRLTENKSKKMVWIAGGIGVTPFRSMTKYLLDTTQKRDIIFFYTARSVDQMPYRSLFNEASKKIGLKLMHVITDKEHEPKNWKGHTGHLTENVIKKEVPDYKERIYYISGAVTMVNAYKEILKKIGVPTRNIITDYFSGY